MLIGDERPFNHYMAHTQAVPALPGLPYRAAALVLWPRLDRERLRHCHDDPTRIARLVEHRTAASRSCIIEMLEQAVRSIVAQAAPAPAAAPASFPILVEASSVREGTPTMILVAPLDWPNGLPAEVPVATPSPSHSAARADNPLEPAAA